MAKAKPRVHVARSEEPQHYAVSLPNNRTAIVEATNEGEAYQKYKEVMGIRSSDHMPEIAVCDPDDFEVDEHGIVVPNIGVKPKDEIEDGES